MKRYALAALVLTAACVHPDNGCQEVHATFRWSDMKILRQERFTGHWQDSTRHVCVHVHREELKP